MNSIQRSAPAKINLSFRIKHRRADGFHEVETLMAPISLADELTITRVADPNQITLSCGDPSLSVGDDNLVMGATRLFLKAAGMEVGLHLQLQKRIPHGAGLGGGSSDAAATLLALNELLETGIASEKLAQLGAEIGSDVAFFVFESAALCRGRGELVEPVTLPVRLRLLLLKPAFGVPTPWAYARWNASRLLPGIPSGPQEFAGYTFSNDLERPVFEKYVFLARAKQWLLAQAEIGAAMLSGSGATLFAVLRDGADAQALAAKAKTELDPDLWTSACETIAST